MKIHDFLVEFFDYMKDYRLPLEDVDINENEQGAFLAILVYFLKNEPTISLFKLESYFVVLNRKYELDQGEPFFKTTFKNYGDIKDIRIRKFINFIKLAILDGLVNVNCEYKQKIFFERVDFNEERFEITERGEAILRPFAEMPEEVKSLLDWVLEKGKLIPSDLSRIIKYQQELDEYFRRSREGRARGDIYERFIGFLFERNRCQVEYKGIKSRCSGQGDGGIDLICCNGDKIFLIQCKNWKKNIPPKEVQALIGAVENYKNDYPDKEVKGAFFTNSFFSYRAIEEAQKYGIELVPNMVLPKYSFPMIKCNIDINKNKKKYYLPTDDNYDEVKLNIQNGDCYCLTVLEAEFKGFKRASLNSPSKRRRRNKYISDREVIKHCLEAIDRKTQGLERQTYSASLNEVMLVTTILHKRSNVI